MYCLFYLSSSTILVHICLVFDSDWCWCIYKTYHPIIIRLIRDSSIVKKDAESDYSQAFIFRLNTCLPLLKIGNLKEVPSFHKKGKIYIHTRAPALSLFISRIKEKYNLMFEVARLFSKLHKHVQR